MIQILQFADVINRYDFIDSIIQFADRGRFEISVCRKTDICNVAEPIFPDQTKHRIIKWKGKLGIVPAAFRLAKLLKEWQIDVVHAHHFEPALVAALAVRMQKRSRLVFGRHYSDLVLNLPEPKRQFFIWLERLINCTATRIIVPSTMISILLTNLEKIERTKIDIIPYGFVPEKYADISDQERRDLYKEFDLKDKFIIVSVGKLTTGKGVRFLADAASTLKESIPNLVLVYVGDGDERAYLEQFIRDKHLESTIKIAGWRNDVIAFIAVADVVVQPTLSEAFSQVMGETMSMNKPLIISDVSGATDIIRSGENGILVPKADSKALSDAIEKLYSEPQLRDNIGNRGKDFIDRELSIESIIPLYERSYLTAAN